MDILDITPFKNIMILSGAGVSFSSGLPLFTSGNYEDIHKILEDRVPNAEGNDCHRMVKVLEDQGKLMRVYTQNVDSLYQKSGVSEDKVVEFHGSILKDNVVKFGMIISSDVQNKVIYDLTSILVNPPDLVIVMGTSLQVSPFCTLPNLVPRGTTRILVDIDPAGCMSNTFHEKNCASWEKWGKKKVTKRQQWCSKRWVDHIYMMTCEDFSKIIIGQFTHPL
jgi:NAD-dependent SIR2 family protein deacetylase